MNKPTVLYRGIILDDKTFSDFNFTEIPMPIIHFEQGKKCVSDGQEYGLYFTESAELAQIYAGVGKDSLAETHGGQDHSRLSNIRINNSFNIL